MDQLVQQVIEIIAKKKKVDPYELLIAEAQTAPPGCEGLFFLPYLTGERCPYPDPNARGGWIGLTSRTSRDMMIRALLEGVTYGMRDALEIMFSASAWSAEIFSPVIIKASAFCEPIMRGK